ncbi:bifunctional adenosylcobinamide kinase/adenosylcobinamide-phosphate guanylyltransferase [Thermocoleostomius sinensis]|uniref:Adenosylcobinamide kinase n=1 Tax=Thermocoleostomius sinensis A174 TaxID=2016057 RepID=A0A9E8ZJ52_9CYAN|nr:bifunctional adenosylcobinamide kinase/adenosylcobinamide-phosphate guanylyltransferase [Thermocoleostomius sinensis]WAL62684.1 bifunctional adenosylcobinamide kinase/adenosylcobinamide-phosphate guanylyltransferase [Thermocoleostomius sinensis A174]
MSQPPILVTGPARSGKSEWAEMLAVQSGQPVIYVATAHLDPNDPDWQARIAEHQRRRPASWQTIEAPIELAATIRRSPASACLLIDSLGTWLANFLDQDDTAWEHTAEDLLQCLATTDRLVILVSEEAGWGVVPAYPSGRQFRDRLGKLTRHIGGLADPVYLVTGGYALNLSQLGVPLVKCFSNNASTRDQFSIEL